MAEGALTKKAVRKRIDSSSSSSDDEKKKKPAKVNKPPPKKGSPDRKGRSRSRSSSNERKQKIKQLKKQAGSRSRSRSSSDERRQKKKKQTKKKRGNRSRSRSWSSRSRSRSSSDERREKKKKQKKKKNKKNKGHGSSSSSSSSSSDEESAWEPKYKDLMKSMLKPRLKEKQNRPRLGRAIQDAETTGLKKDDEDLIRAKNTAKVLDERKKLLAAMAKRDEKGIEKELDIIQGNLAYYVTYYSGIQREVYEAECFLDDMERERRKKANSKMRMDRNTMSAIRNFKCPPESVKHVIQGALLLLRFDMKQTSQWGFCTSVCTQGLLTYIMDFDVKTVHPEILATAKEVLSTYKLKQIEPVSHAAASFYVWGMGTVDDCEKHQKEQEEKKKKENEKKKEKERQKQKEKDDISLSDKNDKKENDKHDKNDKNENDKNDKKEKDRDDISFMSDRSDRSDRSDKKDKKKKEKKEKKKKVKPVGWKRQREIFSIPVPIRSEPPSRTASAASSRRSSLSSRRSSISSARSFDSRVSKHDQGKSKGNEGQHKGEKKHDEGKPKGNQGKPPAHAKDKH